MSNDGVSNGDGFVMPPKTRLACPCGQYFQDESEDGLVAAVQKHLSDAHPGMDYTRDEILFIAY